MNFLPLGKRVLIEREEELKTTASGIIIPDNASKEKPSEGKVIAISKEVEGISEGDRVVKYLVLNTDDILGIIK